MRFTNRGCEKIVLAILAGLINHIILQWNKVASVRVLLGNQKTNSTL